MKFRRLTSAIVTATLGLTALSSPNQCLAQGKSTKPSAGTTTVVDQIDDGAVVVVAVNAIDSLIPNIQHIARMVGAGAAAGGISTVLNQYAGGLDRTRPFGAFLNLDENGQPAPIVCLPIDNLEQFFEQLSVFGEANDLGDGLFEFNFGSPIYAKKVGKWLYVARSEDELSDIAENMADVLPKMIQKYDIRAQVNPQNVPEDLVTFFMGQMQAGLDQGMAAQSGNMTAEEQASARETSEQMIEQMKEAIEGTEKIVIGLAVNKQEKRTILDFGSQFIADSKYAKQMEKLKASKTTVAGVPQDGSMMALQTFQLVEADEIAQLETTLDASLKTAFKAIDEKAKDPASAARAKEFIDKAVEIFVDSAKQGKMESALNVSVESALNIVASISVADGAKVAALASEISSEAAKEKWPFQLKTNTGKHAGFTLHNASVALPPDAGEAAKKMFGSSVTIAIATGPKAVHIAVGQNCDVSLKSAIDRAAAKPTAPAEMVKMRLVMSQLLNYIQSIEPTPVSEAMLNAAAAGNDRIQIDSQSIERGMIFRLSLEDGVLKAIAAGAKAGQAGGGF